MSTDKDQPRQPATSFTRPIRTTSGVGDFSAFTPITSLTIPKSRYQHMQRVSRFLKAQKRRQ